MDYIAFRGGLIRAPLKTPEHKELFSLLMDSYDAASDVSDLVMACMEPIQRLARAESGDKFYQNPLYLIYVDMCRRIPMEIAYGVRNSGR